MQPSHPGHSTPELAQELLFSGLPRVGGDISLRKLQIFLAVAHAGNLTRAARILALTQPTMSQQLSALEAAIGNKLFERSTSGLQVTEFGLSFARHAESVLRSARELEDMVATFGKGQMQSLRAAGLPSALRALLPGAMQHLQARGQILDLDLHEGGPAEVLELLYARRINLALLATNSLQGVSAGFAKLPLMSDPYVLVVPEALNLDGVTDPEQQLPPEQRALLQSNIQFSFGSDHSRRLQEWFDKCLPESRTVVRARSFEMVVEMVRGGLGVCVAPALSAAPDAVALSGLRLYRLGMAPREIAAIIPSHYQRQEPYLSLLEALRHTAARLPQPQLAPAPPFISSRQSMG